MRNEAYEDIMSLRGFDEFKALAGRLSQLAANRRSLPEANIRVPNFLFVEAPGAGVTTQIRLLTRLLQETRLMRFTGEKRFFEWVLGEDAFEPGGGFDRLLRQVNAAAGFYSQFRGVIGVELGRWASRPDDSRMTRFLDFVNDALGQIAFVFVVESQSDERLARLHRALSGGAPVEIVRCPLPSARDMSAYLVDFLARRGFSATGEAVAAIEAFMPRLVEAEGFDGLQAMSALADEIVYRMCAAHPCATTAVRAEDLAFVTKERGYIDRFDHRDASRKKIGFERVG